MDWSKNNQTIERYKYQLLISVNIRINDLGGDVVTVY